MDSVLRIEKTRKDEHDMMKQKHIGSAVRTAAVTALIVSLMSAATVFWAVNAGSNVSPTDADPSGGGGQTITQQVLEQISELLPEEAPQGESDSGVHTVTVRRNTPSFLTPRHYLGGTNYSGYLPSSSFQGSYRSELNNYEKIIYDGFYNNYVRNASNDGFTITFDPSIEFDASHCVKAEDPKDDVIADEDIVEFDDYVLSAAGAFFYDHPEAFWIRSFNYGMTFELTGEPENKGYFSSLSIYAYASYPNAYNDLSAYKTGLAAAVESVKASRVCGNRYYTARAIHDYVCQACNYDYDAVYSSDSYTYGYAYTAVPAFTGKGKFVCEGYSKAVKLLCNELGIPCVLVSGMGMSSSTSGGPHMWNYIQMEDGNWYGVDATWDDAWVPASHSYFMIGSETVVTGSTTFGQNHIPDGQIMSSSTTYALVFPSLSESAYFHYIVDVNPTVTLTTLGASIRVSDPYGIRFGVQIKRDDALSAIHLIPEFGTLIIPSTTLGDNELTIETPSVRKIKANYIYSQDDTQYTYTGVLVGIPTSFFNTNIKGRGYLIYEASDGMEHIVYSDTVERSFVGVAQSAYDNYSRIPNPTPAQLNILNKVKTILGIA